MTEKILCVDLRSFSHDSSWGVEAYISRCGFKPTAFCFLNFHTMFVLEYDGIDDRLIDPISVGQNGTPCNESWSLSDFRNLVGAIHAEGIKVYFGLLANTISPVWHNTNYKWKHPELLQTKIDGSLMWGNAVNVLKRLANGTYFDDLLADKLQQIIDDYSFDAYVAGDGMLGLRGPRETLMETDFSTDMTTQFSEWSGIMIDKNISYQERRHLICSSYYEEWVRFWVWRWKCHISKLRKRLSPKTQIFALDAWSRSPENCRYDFGIDYRELYESGLSGVFIRAGESSKWRKHKEGEYAKEECSVYTFLAHKAYEPRLKYFWVQPVVNVPEFWNTVEDLPNVSRRELNAYMGLHYQNGKYWDKVLSGICLIWANDLDASDWAFLTKEWREAISYSDSFRSPIGYSLLSASRGRFNHLLMKRMLDAGLPIQTITDINSGKSVFLGQKDQCPSDDCFIFDGDRIYLGSTAMTFEQGVEEMKKRIGISSSSGRLSGCISVEGKLVLHIENFENLFYEDVGLILRDKKFIVHVAPDSMMCLEI